jgi:hypothetical protein
MKLDDAVAARASVRRAEAWRHRARAFANTCLGFFWLACMLLVAVVIVKLWTLTP